MKIACIGWGSLIWSPGNLLIQRKWYSDGPLLPIEFARQSRDHRITLVITDSATPVRTLWALMATDDIREAKKSLAIREVGSAKKIDNKVNFVEIDEKLEEMSDSKELKIKKTVQNWLHVLSLDAAVWTALPPKFKDEDDKTPSKQEVLDYLNYLDINARQTAEEYIRKTPIQIDTEYRRAIEKELGWTPIS